MPTDIAMKRVDIKFRIVPRVILDFYQVMRKENIDASDLISKMMSRYVFQYRNRTEQKKNEKRRHLRKQVSIPAMLQFHVKEREIHCKCGIIKDISLGGIRIRLKDDANVFHRFKEKIEGMEIIFSIPEMDCAAVVSCDLEHVVDDVDLELGASYVDVEEPLRECLSQYLTCS